MFFILPGGRNGFNLLIHFLATKTRHETSGLNCPQVPETLSMLGSGLSQRLKDPPCLDRLYFDPQFLVSKGIGARFWTRADTPLQKGGGA